jgi:protein-tyrosine phosphatase
VSNWFRTYGFAEVTDDLLIGAYPLDEDDVSILRELGVMRVLNLAQDAEYRPGEREVVERALLRAGIYEYRVDLEDYGQLPPAMLEQAVADVTDWLDYGLRTYVHCRAGWQRSPAVAAAVLAVLREIDVDAALDFVQMQKPTADPLPHQREDLHRWWEERQASDIAPAD